MHARRRLAREGMIIPGSSPTTAFVSRWISSKKRRAHLRRMVKEGWKRWHGTRWYLGVEGMDDGGWIAPSGVLFFGSDDYSPTPPWIWGIPYHQNKHTWASLVRETYPAAPGPLTKDVLDAAINAVDDIEGVWL